MQSDQHDILVLIANAQKAPINAHAEIPNDIRGLNFGPSLHIHILRMPQIRMSIRCWTMR